MEPMELYVLSVYKFKLFQRLSTSSTGFLCARVCTVMFILCKHVGIKHACSWRLIRVMGLKSGFQWFSDSAVHQNCFRGFKFPVLRPHLIPVKLKYVGQNRLAVASVFFFLFNFQGDSNVQAILRSSKSFKKKKKNTKLFSHYKGKNQNTLQLDASCCHPPQVMHMSG